jgi:CRISPR system Cascade subunit CasA
MTGWACAQQKKTRRTIVPEPKFNLLTEPLISVEQPGGNRVLRTLPQVLGALGQDSVSAFPALQVHQSHAWHAFLVQLAAIALHEGQLEAGPQDAETWARLLRALTGGRDEPWCLLVEDLARPAFLQPPVPERSLEGFKNAEQTPDAIDLLVTSKNHDVKAERIGIGAPEHWIFALVSLQTMQGVLGAGQYGIARMNGGFGNRPCFAYAPGTGWDVRFLRDLGLLLEGRESVASKYEYKLTGGKALLWLEPWDGKKSLPLHGCDPFFIEICRRVRLEWEDGRLQARTAGTQVPRLNAKDQAGVTGDPWTPVIRAQGKALTLPGDGFSYSRMQELLFSGDYDHGLAGALTSQDTLCIASALVRGQGKTEGWHERILPIPAPARRMFGSAEGKQRLSAMARSRVNVAAKAQKQVLKPALCALLQEGREKLDYADSRAEPWLQSFDREVDAIFFEALWEDLALSAEDADRAWERRALDAARQELGRAIHSAPLSAARRYRAIAAGERLFSATSRKTFPELFHRDTEGAA